MSKCRAVPGTAFADVGRSRVIGVELGGQFGAASVGLGARQAAQTERSGVRRLDGEGYRLPEVMNYLLHRVKLFW